MRWSGWYFDIIASTPMATLTYSEKAGFEKLLNMSSGYVLDFSNRTFQEFVYESTARDIYDNRYHVSGGSKANLLRGFWKVENNAVVGKLMNDLLNYVVEFRSFSNHDILLTQCRNTVSRLLAESPVPELDALTAISNERDFEVVAKAVRDAIERNEPEAGLDRLHTYVIKYVRYLCKQRGIFGGRDKPLHSLFGEYVKSLRNDGLLEAHITDRILRSSISILEAFNDVRNKQSLAHDNPVLNYEEALLIFNNIANTVRFLRNLEARRKQDPPLDEIPF